LRANRPRVFTLFAVFALNIFVYSLADFLSVTFGATLWTRLRVAAGALTPASALAFFLEFLGVARRPARRARNAMLAGSLGGLVVAASPLVHSDIAKIFVGVYAISGLAAVVSALWGKMHSAPTRVERARLLYLFVGACLAVVFSILDFLPRYGFPYPLDGFGSIATTLFLFFLSQTLQRHRLLDLHELLGKIVVVTTLGLVLAAIYFLLVIWMRDRPGLFLFNTLVASLVILSLFEPLREKVEEWVVATLFRERFELVRQLEALRDRVGTVIDPGRLATVLLDGLVETRRVTHTSLWLLAEDRPGYRLLDSRGPPPVSFLEPATGRALLWASGSGQKAILLENLERRLSELRTLLPPEPGETTDSEGKVADELRRLDDAAAAMATMRAGIAMPLTAGDRVVGFLSCWDERVPESFASDEIAALLEVAERSALVIENSKLYQQMKERDRLAALGEMAAGLAHEIRNPLAAIKGATQYLSPEKLPSEDREFLDIIVEEVNRLNGVVTQFLDYSRPLKTALVPVEVNDVILRTIKLIQGAVPAQVELKLELAERLPRVLADAEHLKQVFLNLTRNAFEAMPQGGTLLVRTRVARDDAAVWRESARSETVEVRFQDSGPGIPDEARDHIFVPFYTTKEKGTGLGLAICQRIIKAHQGTIGLVPAAGHGAEFVIALPGLREDRVAEPSPSPAPGEMRALPEPDARGRRKKKRRA
jgi:signal transduction histidine kinase